MVQDFVRSPSYKNDFKVCKPMKKWHELAQPIMRTKNSFRRRKAETTNRSSSAVTIRLTAEGNFGTIYSTV